MGESLALEEALVSEQAAVGSPASLLPPLTTVPLFLRVGGEDVHLVLRTLFALMSALLAHGSDEKLLDIKFGRSGLGSVMFVSRDEALGGSGLQLH